MTKDELTKKVARLRLEMHEAPMAQIYTDHKGNKTVGVHTSAWATSSRKWAEAKKELENLA